jgi:hypothetical protein
MPSKLYKQRRRFDRISKRLKTLLFWDYHCLPCTYCGMLLSFQYATLDHKISIYDGGSNDINNIVIACKICNDDRKSQPLEQWQPTAIHTTYKFMLRGLLKMSRLVEFKNEEPALREPPPGRLLRHNGD